MKLFNSLLNQLFNKNVAALFTVLTLGAVAQASSIRSSYLSCFGGDTCTTTISWQTNSGNGVVTVEVIGSDVSSERRQKLFACGDRGNQSVNWIRSNGDRYIFRLYEGVSCPSNTYPANYQLGYESAREEVRANSGYGYDDEDDDYTNYSSRLSFSRPSWIGNDLFLTTIKWKKASTRGTGVVTVSAPGENEKLFACGDEDSQEVNWIKSGVTYKFKLYEGKACPTGVTYPNVYQLGVVTRTIKVRAVR